MVYINFTYMYILYDIHIESSPCLQKTSAIVSGGKISKHSRYKSHAPPPLLIPFISFFSPPSPLLPDKAGTGV